MTNRTRYRGYIICENVINGHIWVEKDGHTICQPSTFAKAKEAIDAILD